MTLTKIKVDKIKPEPKPVKHLDGDGLYLYVTPAGSKLWRYRYTFLGKENTLTIGSYPEFSLADARDEKYRAKKLLLEGKDPNSVKKEIEREKRYNALNTFEAVAQEWFDLNKDSWSAKYSDKVWNRLDTYVFPRFGKMPISMVNGLDIINDAIRPLEKEGKTETSHKLLQNCSAIFRLAFLTKRVPYNPLSDLRGILKPHRSKRMPTIRIDELPNFLNELEAVQTDLINKLAMRLLILTFLRQGELRRLKWSYIDIERKLVFIPAELMKMRREHIVPLSNQAIKTLEEIKCISGYSEFVFPTKNKIKYPFMNENVLNDIIKETEFEGRLVAHGFRSLASTTLNELGCSPDVIERQLAHEPKNQVRSAYNRAEYLPQRVEMMQKWADCIDRVVLEAQIKKAA